MKHYILNAVAIVGLLASAPAYAATAAKPTAQHAQVSACTQAIGKSDRALAASKASSGDIAMAWQHMDAAKQAQKARQASACVSESHEALKLLGTTM